MKKEKLVVLLGMLMALIFFFLGLNQWLKTKEEVQPPPLVVSPPLAKTPEEPPKVEAPTQEVKREEHKQEEKPIQKSPEKDIIAQRIREEKVIKEEAKPKEAHTKTAQAPQKRDTPEAEKKVHVIQIGAFVNKEEAQKAVEKAKKMGYSASIVEENNFHKVRVKVVSEDINSELNKLRNAFGNVVIAQRIREEKVIKEEAKPKEAHTKTAQAPQKRDTPEAEKKIHVIQIGAFVNKEEAKKAVEKAKKMGYSASIVEENNFHKVRVKVVSEEINSELNKLRNAFGGAILIK